MSHSSASTPPTMPPTHDTQDAQDTHEARRSFSSECSNPETSIMSFESSFRLESGYPTHDSNTEKHPKGKRKRTTTQDKTILEAAYNSNPKPDKAARLDIVSRVTLNEKEVQIWFQNRRQNDRRKSRPLSPQEIAALRYGGGVQIISSDPVPTSIGASNVVETPEDAPVKDEEAHEVDNLPPSPQDTIPQLSSPSSPKVFAIEPELEENTASLEPELPRVDTTPSSQKFEPESFFSQSMITPAPYMSNRRSFGSSFSTPSNLERAGDDSFRMESFISFGSNASSPPASILPPPSSSSSQVRLSLSLDGKAELVSSQPSPPRLAQQLPLAGDADTLPPVRANRTLHRSRSALPGITLPPISTLTAHLPPQLGRGRSRDVHAWESCCEADTYDELTMQAENESSGNAVAAISLLRSSSSSASLSNLVHGHSTSVLQSNPGKRNAPTHRSAHREGGAKKAKLSRTTSSVARMQSLPPVSVDNTAVPADLEKPVKGLSVILSPSGDSDKENWSPNSEGNTYDHRRRLLPSPKMPAPSLPSKNPRRVGRVLGEQDSSTKRSLLFGSRANTAPSSKSRDNGLTIFEDKGNSGATRKGIKRDGQEVEGFVREVSPAKRGDMDCVAGLLSLSQGNWR